MMLPLVIILYLLGMYQEAENIKLLEAISGEEVTPFYKGLLLLGWPALELYKLVLDVVVKEDDEEGEDE